MTKKLNTEQLFAIKQVFLREIPHPKLIEKQIIFLGHSVSDVEFVATEQDNLLSYLESYIHQLGGIKLSIANASDPEDLGVSLLKLYNLQMNLIRVLAVLIDGMNFTERHIIKLSNPFDVYSIIKFIKEQSLSETEIKEYLYRDLNADNGMEYSPLSIAVIRAAKIISNG